MNGNDFKDYVYGRRRDGIIVSALKSIAFLALLGALLSGLS